jgi:hypothetical protein
MTTWLTGSDDTPGPDECVWPINECCAVTQALPDHVVELTQQAAVNILWVASGRQFGVCESTRRPCRVTCRVDGVSMWDLVSRRSSGDSPWRWALAHCGRCRSDTCSCTSTEAVRLWHRSPIDIVDVSIDGASVDPAAYRLDGRLLRRVDGQRWPDCQDMNADLGEPDTWSITYTHGRPVPAAGQLAAGVLSCELAKAVVGDETCELPKRVQTVTRQGVTVGFVDPMSFIQQGLTGLYTVDLWLNAVNPHRLARRARAYGVDAARAARRSARPTGS